MPIKGDALSFGNVWKQEGRKTKTLIYEVTCKKEEEKEKQFKNPKSKDKRHELSVLANDRKEP